ncbi:hypothetical protein [Methanohalophilus sp. DAL1]|jgi:hypothetical protein|uniref:hypothetical protein n=1 Tax=Methanohalophilus sp. DAL1 TaxID=1864608 RepID=UPI0008182B69|nr:hypothetical protein [Methanohalophilus sp. DAL1]OBZ35235.1 MAG: hypothetical protein A9957_08250 [Methanohalophilus sp. DAL1]
MMTPPTAVITPAVIQVGNSLFSHHIHRRQGQYREYEGYYEEINDICGCLHQMMIMRSIAAASR